MKHLFIILSFGLTLTIFSGCGALYGGHISDCQKHTPARDEPKRQIRPAALVFDILSSPIIALPIDFATGGIYKPCSLSHKVQDSLDSAKEQQHIRINGRDKFLTLFNDPFQGLFCEDMNIGIEHPFTKNFTLGFDFATVHPIGAFYVNPLSYAQRDWPGTVYYGTDMKLEFKYFLNKRTPSYIGLNMEYKKLWYNNVPFIDERADPYLTSDDGYEDVYQYTRDERTKVWGLDLIYGREFALIHKSLMIDYFFGLGIRSKYRNINTYAISASLQEEGAFVSQIPVNGFVTSGNSAVNTVMFTPIFGIKMGLNTFKKKQDNFGLSIGQRDSQN